MAFSVAVKSDRLEARGPDRRVRVQSHSSISALRVKGNRPRLGLSAGGQRGPPARPLRGSAPWPATLRGGIRPRLRVAVGGAAVVLILPAGRPSHLPAAGPGAGQPPANEKDSAPVGRRGSFPSTTRAGSPRRRDAWLQLRMARRITAKSQGIVMSRRASNQERTTCAGVAIMSAVLKALEGEKYLSIETYRKDGTPVRTPAWFIPLDERLFLATGGDSFKVKRLNRNPKARIAACDMH